MWTSNITNKDIEELKMNIYCSRDYLSDIYYLIDIEQSCGYWDNDNLDKCNSYISHEGVTAILKAYKKVIKKHKRQKEYFLQMCERFISEYDDYKSALLELKKVIGDVSDI